MELVTGRAGTPHITSQQDRQKHQGIWGDGAYIMNTGNLLEPEVQSSNKILIKDGALMYQGALFSVKVGTTDEVTINNGNQGMKRKDLVAVRYKYDSAQNKETGEWVVIQGTPAESNPVAPSGTSGNIQNGDATVDCPVFIVNLDGINVTGVDIIPEVAPTIPQLNGNLKVLEYDEGDVHFTSAWEVRHCGVMKMNKIVTIHARIYTGTIVENHEYVITSTIDKDIRPSSKTPLCAVAGDIYMQNVVACMCMIDTDGKIYLKVSGVNKQYVDISGTYMVP